MSVFSKARRPSTQARKMPSFDQARGDVRQMIQQERVEALVKKLKDKASIKVSE